MIYIIDDDRYVLRGFQILLQSADLESRIYDNVEEFIEVWEPDIKDIIILDIHMPGLNGCDLLNYLKERKVYLPVIIVTAYDEKESHDLATRYGALAYLTKPVNDDVLLDLLQNRMDEGVKIVN